MTKKKSTDDIYDDNSEASRKHGVRRKGSGPPSGGKVTVTHKRKGMSMSMLNKYQLTVLVTDTVAGLAFIYANVDDATFQAHMMWAFALTHVIALVPTLFRKLE